MLLNKCAQLSPHAAGGIRLCVMCWILSNTHRLGNRATSLEGRSEKVSLQCIYINVYVTEPITREKISKGPREREREREEIFIQIGENGQSQSSV